MVACWTRLCRWSLRSSALALFPEGDASDFRRDAVRCGCNVASDTKLLGGLTDDHGTAARAPGTSAKDVTPAKHREAALLETLSVPDYPTRTIMMRKTSMAGVLLATALQVTGCTSADDTLDRVPQGIGSGPGSGPVPPDEDCSNPPISGCWECREGFVILVSCDDPLPAGPGGGPSGPTGPTGPGGPGGQPPLTPPGPPPEAFEAGYQDEWDKLKPAEKSFVVRNPRVARRFREAARSALSAARSNFPGFAQEDDRADAFRHAYWNALMVRAANEALAKEFADAHEDEPVRDAHHRRAREMDFHNNHEGRQIGATADPPGTSLEQRVLDAIAAGKLDWFKGP